MDRIALNRKIRFCHRTKSFYATRTYILEGRIHEDVTIWTPQLSHIKTNQPSAH
jgi:hypothetical protein